jgi:hypothetical protein
MQELNSSNSTLRRFQFWYASQCNGDWEHQHEITIKSLDNPGWRVEIDLSETRWQDANFAEVRAKEADSDWMICSKRGALFVGAGDPDKLERILDLFLSMINK